MGKMYGNKHITTLKRNIGRNFEMPSIGLKNQLSNNNTNYKFLIIQIEKIFSFKLMGTPKGCTSVQTSDIQKVIKELG